MLLAILGAIAEKNGKKNPWDLAQGRINQGASTTHLLRNAPIKSGLLSIIF